MKNPTQHPVHELLQARWSPYEFDANAAVNNSDLKSIFEAARWAMSAYNAQPWRYIVANRATNEALWHEVLSTLVEPNQNWAKHVPVLALGMININFPHDGSSNPVALHDLGAASAFLTLEATARGLVVHQMSGIVAEKVTSTFSLPDTIQPATALAIGYSGKNDALDNAYASRDEKPRERKPFSEIILRGEL